MTVIPDSATRVPEHTTPSVNEEIRAVAEESVERHAEHPEEIARRLGELDAEWDVERALEANAAALTLVGVALGATVDRRFLILPAAVAGFLLQHAVQGWCPPLPVMRRLGFRTRTEIDEERMALKAMRGDFAAVEVGSPAVRARQALHAARV